MSLCWYSTADSGPPLHNTASSSWGTGLYMCRIPQERPEAPQSTLSPDPPIRHLCPLSPLVLVAVVFGVQPVLGP